MKCALSQIYLLMLFCLTEQGLMTNSFASSESSEVVPCIREYMELATSHGLPIDQQQASRILLQENVVTLYNEKVPIMSRLMATRLLHQGYKPDTLMLIRQGFEHWTDFEQNAMTEPIAKTLIELTETQLSSGHEIEARSRQIGLTPESIQILVIHLRQFKNQMGDNWKNALRDAVRAEFLHFSDTNQKQVAQIMEKGEKLPDLAKTQEALPSVKASFLSKLFSRSPFKSTSSRGAIDISSGIREVASKATDWSVVRNHLKAIQDNWQTKEGDPGLIAETLLELKVGGRDIREIRSTGEDPQLIAEVSRLLKWAASSSDSKPSEAAFNQLKRILSEQDIREIETTRKWFDYIWQVTRWDVGMGTNKISGVPTTRLEFLTQERQIHNFLNSRETIKFGSYPPSHYDWASKFEKIMREKKSTEKDYAEFLIRGNTEFSEDSRHRYSEGYFVNNHGGHSNIENRDGDCLTPIFQLLYRMKKGLSQDKIVTESQKIIGTLNSKNSKLFKTAEGLFIARQLDHLDSSTRGCGGCTRLSFEQAMILDQIIGPNHPDAAALKEYLSNLPFRQK